MFWGMNPPPCPPKIGLKRAKSFTPLSQWAMAPIEKKNRNRIRPYPNRTQQRNFFTSHKRGDCENLEGTYWIGNQNLITILSTEIS